jgi:hypothetical protein
VSPEDLRWSAKMLRDIADEIERGTWGSVDVRIENDLRDKPRSWHDGGRYRGKDLVGRLVTVDLSLPGPSSGAQGEGKDDG